MGFVELLFGVLASKWTILAVGVLYFLYKKGTAKYKFFEEKGISYDKPLPFIGNFKDILFQRRAMADTVANIYSHHTNKRQIFSKDIEPLFSRSLFNLTGDHWRNMRSTLSPAFTGSKMRLMFQLIGESAKILVNELKEQSKSESRLVVEVKDLFTKYTNDVIASSAFGLQTNSIKDPNNEFYVLGKKITKFSGLTTLKFFLMISFPYLAKVFKLQLFSTKFMNYFRSLVHDTIKLREKEHVTRPDMIHLLMEAKKGKLSALPEDSTANATAGFATVEEHQTQANRKHFVMEDDDITGNCLAFFLAGFETSASSMSFTAHEICANPEVQKKLIEEVDEVNEALDGKPLTYEALQKMKYLDMVVTESLRMWPPAIATDRKCVKEYRYTETDGKEITINVGDTLWIPIIGIHHDDRYYPNPTKFDPERFSDENKANIKPFTYLPFGAGPRNCIGSRFALMESKALIFHLLTNFTFEVSEKTQIPLKLKKAGFSFTAENGFWIHLKPRVKS